MDPLLLFDDPGHEPHRDRYEVSFCTNQLFGTNPMTGLVAYRLWRINREGFKRSNRRLHPVLLITVESGAVYSAALLVLLILYKTDSWFQYVILDAVSNPPSFFSLKFVTDALLCRFPPLS